MRQNVYLRLYALKFLAVAIGRTDVFMFIFSFIGSIISMLVVGALSGFCAARLMGDWHAPNIIRNILIGIAGSFVGSLLFGLIGFSAHGFIARIIVSIVGACAFIWIARKLRK